MTKLEKEVVGMVDMLTTFVARYEIYGAAHRELTKVFLKEYCEGFRSHEALFGQFLAQLDHIIKEDEGD